MIKDQISTQIKDLLLTQDIYNDSLETQLIQFANKIRNDAYNDCKAIFAAEIRNEIFKNRNLDPDKNQEIINIIGSCYTSIEIEIQKKLTRSKEGEHILSIYPSKQTE